MRIIDFWDVFNSKTRNLREIGNLRTFCAIPVWNEGSFCPVMINQMEKKTATHVWIRRGHHQT
jgi:hypothetical protein